MKVIKYGAEWCGSCRKASELLENSNINYEEIDITENPDSIDNKGVNEIPYIEVVNDEGAIVETFKTGFTQDNINELKNKYGETILRTVNK